MPDWSAVVIVRNEEKYVADSIKSLLNQSVAPYRVVVVDDGSTDRTPEILKELDVEVIRLPDHGINRYNDTLHDVRNAGTIAIKDDPVDWVYSGDGDMMLSPKYVEVLMHHAGGHGAYVASGDQVSYWNDLPWDACRIIKHDWFRKHGMESKWESIYLCIKALVDGHRTLVRSDEDCAVISPRECGTLYAATAAYTKGVLMRRMGGSVIHAGWWFGMSCKAGGCGPARSSLSGYLHGKVEVDDDMARMYRRLLNDHLKARLMGRLSCKSRMIRVDGNNKFAETGPRARRFASLGGGIV